MLVSKYEQGRKHQMLKDWIEHSLECFKRVGLFGGPAKKTYRARLGQAHLCEPWCVNKALWCNTV